MSKIFNRDIELAGGSKITKNGVTIVNADGAVTADIQATAKSIGAAEIALENGKIFQGDAGGAASEKTLGVTMGGNADSDTASITVGGNADSDTASITIGGNADSDTASITIGGNADSDGAVASGSGSASISIGGSTDSDGSVTIMVKQPWYLPGTFGVDLTAEGGGLVGEVPATPTAIAADQAFAFKAAGGLYTQLSATSGAGGGGVYTNDYQVFPDAPGNGDCVYFGFDKKTPAIYIPLSITVGVYSGDACQIEYWNGATWSAHPAPHYDNSDTTAMDGKRPFQATGCLMIEPQSNWGETSVNGKMKYWIRYNVLDASKITTPAVLTDEPGVVNGETGWTPTADGTISSITLADSAATLHTAKDVKLVIWDKSTGNAATLTFTQDKRRQAFGSLNFAVTKNASTLYAFVVQEDETNEPSNVMLEVSITQTTPTHTHGATGLSGTDAGHTHTGGAHTHGLTSATATDAGHTHGSSSLTATDAGHTHGATSLTATDAGHTHGATSLTATPSYS